MICNAFLKRLSFAGMLSFFIPLFSWANIVVLNGLTHENQAQPGESYRGTIQVQNASEHNRSVKIYQRDYWFSYTGESRHDLAGTSERSNANWISFNPELVELQPNEIASVNFEVKVPNDSLIGTYWSVLMVEGIVPPDTSATSGGVTINTAIRYAIQLVTQIGETGTSDIKFLGMELGKQDEMPLLHVALENTGERMLRPELALELFDDEGNSAGIVKAEKRKTYPGTSVMITLELKGIKPGNYNGILVADCDNDNVFGTNVSFEI
ncbi:hypothetical protein SAMN05444274_106110 [Mariniphaga anaerophila]|uniref:DUF3324 domain-containing protein n=1 Tax=Mariniphaga anaerophila TaxID=1484053 RepID=A0A1M5CH48_9BACT|nr:hypothetical protein [Mariniphaga anaerophila]SHF53712.1 hypothetical protein SAMN05444274_106110 [Mariniphaga anaerophila]